MKVLHVFNRHRGGGGSDNAWDETIRISREGGLDVETFSRSSRDLPDNLAGKAQAFFAGIYSLSAAREFGRVLKTFKPDVVHAHELYPLISPWILKQCTQTKVPAVYTCYDFRLTCPVATHFNKGRLCIRCQKNSEWWAVLKNCRGEFFESLAYALRNFVARSNRLFLDNVSQFIVLTDFSKEWLVNNVNVESDRISVLPCSIQLPAKISDQSGDGYVAYAGRFVPEKGVEVLLEAVRKAGVPVKLAGNAPNHPGIKNGDQAECVLIESRDALMEFYRKARMLVVPSIWYETFGIVAAEAMSLGVPVVASRFGALQYTVRDGVSGLLFEMNNPEDLAEKITRIWNDPQLAKSLGEGAGKM